MSTCVAEWCADRWIMYQCSRCAREVKRVCWQIGYDHKGSIWCEACVVGVAELSHYIIVKVGVYTGYMYNPETLTMYQARCPDLEILDNNPVLVKI